MPTIGAKVTQEELNEIVECANRRGITISNLIRTAILSEISQMKMDEPQGTLGEDKMDVIPSKSPQRNLLDLLVESARQRRLQNNSQKP